MVAPASQRISLTSTVREMDRNAPPAVKFLTSSYAPKLAARVGIFAGVSAVIALIPGLIARFGTRVLPPQISVPLEVANIARYSLSFYSGSAAGGGLIGMAIGGTAATTVVVTEAYLFNELVLASTQTDYHHWIIDVRRILEQNIMIPEQYWDDPILSEHACPISRAPIRIPVIDRNHPQHVYERASIRAWIAQNPTSPLTRQRLTEEDLILDEGTFNIIRNRIAQLDAENVG